MTEAEVHVLLGGPPGNYADSRVEPLWGPPEQKKGERKCWTGNTYIYYVWFEDGAVVDKAAFFAKESKKSFFDTFFEWFRKSNDP